MTELFIFYGFALFCSLFIVWVLVGEIIKEKRNRKDR